MSLAKLVDGDWIGRKQLPFVTGATPSSIIHCEGWLVSVQAKAEPLFHERCDLSVTVALEFGSRIVLLGPGAGCEITHPSQPRWPALLVPALKSRTD